MSTTPATAPKQRGLLFSAPMVRALLDGSKTQTRRIMKPQPERCQLVAIDAASPSGYSLIADAYEDEHLVCPYGMPGDELWVRETWRTSREWDHLAPTKLPFAGEHLCEVYLAFAADGTSKELHGKTRVSIHMPRWASRITLKITDVRCERLNDISEEDAKAEGCDGNCPVGYIPAHQASPCAYHYAQLWDSINGHGAWTKNPFVWCLSFRRITP